MGTGINWPGSAAFFTAAMLVTMLIIFALIANPSLYAPLYMFPLPMAVVFDCITLYLLLINLGYVHYHDYGISKCVKCRKASVSMKLQPQLPYTPRSTLPSLHASIEDLESEIRDLDAELIG